MKLSLRPLFFVLLLIVTPFARANQVHQEEARTEEEKFGFAIYQSYNQINERCGQYRPWLLFELYRNLAVSFYWYSTDAEFSSSLDNFSKTGLIELPEDHPRNQGDVNAVSCVNLWEGALVGSLSAYKHIIATSLPETVPSLAQAFGEFGVSSKVMHERIGMCNAHFDIVPYWFTGIFGFEAALANTSTDFVTTLRNTAQTGHFVLPVSGNPSMDALGCATFATGMLVGSLGTPRRASMMTEYMKSVDPNFTDETFAQFYLAKFDALTEGATLMNAVIAGLTAINYDLESDKTDKLLDGIFAD